ncbi:MAG: hypothetical protein WDA03_11930 [Trueperaceae bacterium]
MRAVLAKRIAVPRRWFGWLALAALVLVVAACESSSGYTPPPPPPPATVNISGAWTVVFAPTPLAGSLDTIELTLTQTGSTVSGISHLGTVEFGTVTGTVSGSTATLRVTFDPADSPQGVYIDLVGPATATEINGSFTQLSGGLTAAAGPFRATRGSGPPPPPPPPPQGHFLEGDWILTHTNPDNGVVWETRLSSVTVSGTGVAGIAEYEFDGATKYGTMLGKIEGPSLDILMSIDIINNPDALLNIRIIGTANATSISGTYQVISQGGSVGPVVGRRPGSPPPPPPPPPTGLTVNVTNSTFTPMQVTVGDRAAVTVAAGATHTVLLTPRPSSVRIQSSTSGRTSTGEQVGLLLTWDRTYTPTGTTLNVTNVVGSTYFFLRIRNQGSQPLRDLRVNYDLQNEVRDNIVINNNSALYGIGYYRAFTNSRVRANLGTSTSYVFWDNLNLPFTENQAITLVNTR